MGLVSATRTCLRKYADFTGRARRAEYWWFYLASALITAILVVPALILFFVAAASSSTSSSGTTTELTTGGGVSATIAVILYGLAGLVSLALLLPILAVGVRRLHDTDRSGWWLLLGLIPLGGIVVFVFHVLDGTPGPNRFDQDAQGYGHPAQA